LEKKISNHFLSIGLERTTNGEYIADEKFFLDTPGAQGSHLKTGYQT
jgi:hypothetical protein